MSDDEVDALIEFSRDKLQRSHIGIGKEEVSDIRTSSTAWLFLTFRVFSINPLTP